MPRPPLSLPCRQRGIALVLVLWLTVLMTVIAGGFAYTMRNEAMAARNALSLAQARSTADGAVYRTVFELLRPRASTEVWLANGLVHAWNEDGARVLISALDESGKIDLNTAADGLLRGLLQTAGGLEYNAAAQVADAIADWRDPDDLRRPNGAEAAEYAAAGRSYRPANARFEDVAELQRVLGVTPALYAQIAGSLTVHTNMPGVNPVFASRTVLLAIPGATPEVVDTYLAQRQDALAAGRPPPGFPLAMGIGAAALNVWRIRAEVVTPDGVSFVREAVVRQNPMPKRPIIVLLWQEGDRRALAEPEPRPVNEGMSGLRKS